MQKNLKINLEMALKLNEKLYSMNEISHQSFKQAEQLIIKGLNKFQG